MKGAIRRHRLQLDVPLQDQGCLQTSRLVTLVSWWVVRQLEYREKPELPMIEYPPEAAFRSPSEEPHNHYLHFPSQKGLVGA